MTRIDLEGNLADIIGVHHPKTPLPPADAKDMKTIFRWLSDNPEFALPFNWAQAVVRRLDRRNKMPMLACKMAIAFPLAHMLGFVESADSFNNAIFSGSWSGFDPATVRAWL
ncbi:hypothetical protein CU669_08355 [Paramagnetospirillum kuznetsovii]|uniref:Uncharacterized protein n=1 Tax=Paramagnetospirillum kuznetsovii TaxID=2053833 RepID=A0A364P0N4_9PROT|nr:hypothetical protein [Paramagnetospirillum kuznetsovii]RAU22675.1 hypothetical protein CU669_08355 [Paramagnetospirillum kuznetsovii]